MGEWFAKCSDFASEHVVKTVDGISEAEQRNIGKQKKLLDPPDRLVRCSSSRCLPASWALSVSQISKRSRACSTTTWASELREWQGLWEIWHGPLPIEAEEPGFWQQQLLPSHGAEVSRGAVSTILHTLAVGSPGTGGHFVRVAQVFGLADLLQELGVAHARSVQACTHLRSHPQPRSALEPTAEWPLAFLIGPLLLLFVAGGHDGCAAVGHAFVACANGCRLAAQPLRVRTAGRWQP